MRAGGKNSPKPRIAGANKQFSGSGGNIIARRRSSKEQRMTTWKPKRTRRKILQRFRYEPRMTAAELREAMAEIDLTVDELTLVSGARRSRVLDWLHGNEDIPVYVQRDFHVWLDHDEALETALDWAEAHAYDIYEPQGL